MRVVPRIYGVAELERKRNIHVNTDYQVPNVSRSGFAQFGYIRGAIDSAHPEVREYR